VGNEVAELDEDALDFRVGAGRVLRAPLLTRQPPLEPTWSPHKGQVDP
jgi:hypothetical protein